MEFCEKIKKIRTDNNLTQEQFALYSSGNVVTLDQSLENGWYHLLVDGNGFGLAKVIGNTLKNYYPKGLRFHI